MSLNIVLLRPHPHPSPAMPFSVRSVGTYSVGLEFSPPRRKKHFVQLFWTIEGSGILYADGKPSALETGYVAVYYPGELHHIEPACPHWKYRWFTLDGNQAESVIRAFGFSGSPRYSGPCPEYLFQSLEKVITSKALKDQFAASQIGYHILCLAAAATAGEDKNVQLAEAIKAYIEEHSMTNSFGIDQLSEAFSLHRATVSKIFAKAYQVPPVQYLINCRVQRVLLLLQESDQTLDEIASSCGFRTPQYMVRVIQRTTGLSVSSIRRRY